MKRSAFALLSLLPLAACAATSSGHRSGDAAQSEHAFDMLKSLAGTWHSPTNMEGHQNGIDVSYEVISNGSVVMERLFKGTPGEMVTMYHRDGDALVLTHYCAMGNQPHMVLQSFSGQPVTAAFAFDGATGWKGPEQMVMHDAAFTLVDKDHLKSKWTGWVNGKQDHVGEFEFTRVR